MLCVNIDDELRRLEDLWKQTGDTEPWADVMAEAEELRKVYVASVIHEGEIILSDE